MRKFFYLGMLMTAMFIMASCSSTSNPSDAMKTYLSAIQDSDYETLIDGVDLSKVPEKDMKNAREGLTAMMKEKGEKDLKSKGGLKSFEIVSEKISEDGNTAIVHYKQVYGNGQEITSKQKLVKVDGKWLMDIGK